MAVTNNTVEVRMPQFGMGMSDATVTRWLKRDGDSILADEIICEVETAKATAEVVAPQDGVLARILVPEGSSANSQDPLCVLTVSATAPPQSTERNPPESASESATKIFGPVSKMQPGRVEIEPRARRKARELGVDLEHVQGSGPSGRITEEDIERAGKSKPDSTESTMTQDRTGTSTEPGDYRQVSPTRLRRLVAERVTESQRTIPHFTLLAEIDTCEINATREALKRQCDPAPSMTDFVVRALGVALRRVPEAHVRWSAESILQFNTANIAIAVAVGDGVLGPVIRNVEQKSVQQISRESQDLIQRARRGAVKEAELLGGHAMVSNLGMFGVLEFSALIDPLQSAVLAVGAATRAPVIRGERIEIGEIMRCRLSIDHRAVDGAVAAKLLTEFKRLLEQPGQL